jgi:hypothetical protein
MRGAQGDDYRIQIRLKDFSRMSFISTEAQRAPALGLLSIREAADTARVLRDDIDLAMRHGGLRYVRHDGRRMVTPSALREWVQWMHTGAPRHAQ